MNQIAENTVDSENTVNSFDDLDLSPVMRRALKKAGFTTPSPIQAQLIPLAMEGEDVIGQARTGTGKTAAFAIPILEQLDSLEDCRDPQVIVVVPTRELADQVGKETERLAWGVETEVAVLAGGKNINRNCVNSRTVCRSSWVPPGDCMITCNANRSELEVSGVWFSTRLIACWTSAFAHKSNGSCASAHVTAKPSYFLQRFHQQYDALPSLTWSSLRPSTVAKMKWLSRPSNNATSPWQTIANQPCSTTC